MTGPLPPGWHHALQPPLTYRVGRRLYFIDRAGTPWRVRPVYLAPPRWTITARIPPSAQEFHSRLFVDPRGERRLYNPKYDSGWTFNAADWTSATLERQLSRSGAPP